MLRMQQATLPFPHMLSRLVAKLNKDAAPLYVQVTVHRDELRIKQPTRCIKYPKFYFVIKLYMFRASSVPIIRTIGTFHAGYVTAS
jgi:hypothetical protein